jgi:hypothetical protein
MRAFHLRLWIKTVKYDHIYSKINSAVAVFKLLPLFCFIAGTLKSHKVKELQMLYSLFQLVLPGWKLCPRLELSEIYIFRKAVEMRLCPCVSWPFKLFCSQASLSMNKVIVAYTFTSHENHEHELTWLCYSSSRSIPAAYLATKGCKVSITM